MKLHYWILVIGLMAASALWLAPATEARKVAMMEGNAVTCMKTTATVNVQIQGREKSLQAAKDFFDKRVEMVRGFAAKQGVKDLKINNLNYNINPNMAYDSYGQPEEPRDYNVSGNMGIQLMDDETKATKLAEYLLANKMNASLNVSSYMQGGASCNNTTEAVQD